jgi:hypothetical protein
VIRSFQKTVLILISLLLVFYNTAQDIKAQTNNSSSPISVVSQTAYLDTYGYLHIVGEVLNTSNSTARSIQLTASIYDPSHTIIGTASGNADIDVLGPGQASAFAITSNDLSKVASIGSYTLSPSSEPAFGQEKPAFLRLTIGRAYTDSIGTYHIIGEVTNQANSTANFIKVSGAFSNYDRQVIGEGIAYITLNSSRPNRTI